MEQYIIVKSGPIQFGDQCKFFKGTGDWYDAVGLANRIEEYQEILKFRRPVSAKHKQAENNLKFSHLGHALDACANNESDEQGQAEAGIPTTQDKPQEWVEGVCPDVETECEISNHGCEWQWCIVRYNGPALVVVDHHGYTDQHYHKGNIKFRPIRSEAEREAEENHKAAGDLYEFMLETCQATEEVISHRFLAAKLAQAGCRLTKGKE